MSVMAAHLEERPVIFDVDSIRAEFPFLAEPMNGRPVVFLDSGASAQKPGIVIDAQAAFYRSDYANIHRGVYELSQRASDAFDAARRKVQRFLGAADWREIVFTRNTTESINLVAWSYLEPKLQAGRRDFGHPDGAPLQHRALADRRRAPRCQGRGRSGRRRRRTRHGGSSAP